jgi:acetyltransferase-like isoleucine patch superfamily enzyme
VHQPVQLVGRGRIKFGGKVDLGVYPSPFFLSGYIYLEARNADSVIEIEDHVFISNNTCLISGGPGIFIGTRTMIGYNCEIMDSDFHDTHPERRWVGTGKVGKVIIGENVLIGSNVKILKGVTIGNNSVVGNGSVVVRPVPENMIVFGNPAKGGRLLSLDDWTEQEKRRENP